MDRHLDVQGDDFSTAVNGGPWASITIKECSGLPAAFGDCQLLQQHLTRLDLHCSSFNSLPSNTGELTNLERLVISGCSNLQQLPDSLGQLAALKELSLEGCGSLMQLPGSMTQLTALEVLSVVACPRFNQLPDFAQLPSLVRLCLRDCRQLGVLPNSFGALTKLTSLCLQGRSLSSLPSIVWRLPALQQLYLQDFRELSSIPAAVSQLSALEMLVLAGCAGMKSLPDEVQCLSALKELSLINCSRLESLPAGIGQLSALTKLALQHCTSLTSLPESFEQLLSLQQLDLTGCNSLSRLPNCCSLTALHSLNLTGCVGLICQLDGTSGLTAPTGLDTSFGSEPGSMRRAVFELSFSLQQLDLSYCSELVGLADTLPHLRMLTSLQLSGCSNLASLPDLRNNSRLQLLNLSGCSSLEHLPESLGELVDLRVLDLSRCCQLRALPVIMDQMSALNALKLSCCHNLQALPIRNAPGLKVLDLSYCSNIDSLIEPLWSDTDTARMLIMNQTKVNLLGGTGLRLGTVRQSCAGYVSFSREYAVELAYAARTQRLLEDQGIFLELLSRLSWLGVLLGAATFTAALAPPGGYDSGLLFLNYSAADCRGVNETAAYSSVIQCTTAGIRQNCTVNDADPGGCVRKADACTNIDGASCSVRVNHRYLLMFYLTDTLSFGCCMTLIIYVAACSIPISIARQPNADAHSTWLSLIAASYLLLLAVVSGMAALLFGLMSVFPAELMRFVVLPLGVSTFVVVYIIFSLTLRLVMMYPRATQAAQKRCSRGTAGVDSNSISSSP